VKVAVALAVVLAARTAAAHPLDLGYLRLDATGDAVTVALDLDAAAAARLAPDPLAETPLVTDRGDCRWDPASTTIRRAGRTVTIASRAACPAGAATLRWTPPFVAYERVSPRFQLLVKAHWAGGDRVTTLDRTAPQLELGSPRGVAFHELVWSGIEHIGAAPDQWHDGGGWRLPDGLDHILFLIALLLAGGTLLQLAAIATGFTLGHSITLALSALGVVRPPAVLIEPLIALTIAFVAAEAALGRVRPQRWKLAACFGLIHGFGFAGALVELGQLAIVLAAAPVVLALQRHPRAQRIVVRAVGAAIFVAASYWFGRRVIG